MVLAIIIKGANLLGALNLDLLINYPGTGCRVVSRSQTTFFFIGLLGLPPQHKRKGGLAMRD